MIKDIIETHYVNNYENLVKKYSRWTGGTENAEDIVQTAYLRAVQYSDTYDPNLPFDRWFKRILTNSARDFKSMQRGTYVEIDENEIDPEPDINYIRSLWREIVEEIEKTSDPEHKEILSLYFIHGYPPRMIVRVVDMRYKGVNSVISRFKAFIKDKYGNEGSSRRLGGEKS